MRRAIWGMCARLTYVRCDLFFGHFERHTRKTISIVVHPTLRHPSCGVGEGERIAQAGNARSSVFVDQDVFLRHGVHANYAIRLYRMVGERTIWMSSWTTSRSCMRSKHRAIRISFRREASDDLYLGEGVQGNDYHFQPHAGFPLQIPPEVEAIHILIDETERVFLSRVNSHERYYVHIPTVKDTMYASLIVKSLCDVSSVPFGTGCD